MNYIAGWNMPGYLPEVDPWVTDNYGDAVEYLLDEMARYSETLDNDNDYDEYRGAVSNVESARASGVEVSVPLGGCIYWVTVTSEEVTDGD